MNELIGFNVTTRITQLMTIILVTKYAISATNYVYRLYKQVMFDFGSIHSHENPRRSAVFIERFGGCRRLLSIQSVGIFVSL